MEDVPSPFACALAEIAHEAGQLILGEFRRNGGVWRKSDNSPVTDADEQAEALIIARLVALSPQVPVIAEEQMARSGIATPGRRFFLVDPLDGTEEFVMRRDEFTVNIAVIEDGMAVCGVLLAPIRHRAFVGEKGKGAHELIAPPSGALDFHTAKRIHVRSPPRDGMTVLVSRTHRTGESEFYGDEKVASVLPVASSLKFGVLAAGEADLYPRQGPTMEWDTAAGQAVLEAAGGMMRGLDGGIFGYGKPGFRNPGFVARGSI
jgi:3'(2'), 5'-bisphosphate nucleotidase